MEKLNQRLETIKQSGRPGFMMHIVAGYPDLESSTRIARQILDSGADLLEIQIPFSDPVADGPIIASSNETSLSNGMTVESSLSMIADIVDTTEKPILIMTYFNIIYHYGVEKFCKKAQAIGVQGLIVPDYPFDEESQNGLIHHSNEHQLAFIQLIAATTRPERMQEIVKHASGFVYCMARTGTTGPKTVIGSETIDYLQSVRQLCDLPLAVGFGLSEKSQVEALSPHAEIMIVGSALIKEYAGKSNAEGLKAVKHFVEKLTSF